MHQNSIKKNFSSHLRSQVRTVHSIWEYFVQRLWVSVSIYLIGVAMAAAGEIFYFLLEKNYLWYNCIRVGHTLIYFAYVGIMLNWIYVVTTNKDQKVKTGAF